MQPRDGEPPSQFLVNGKKCNVATSETAFSWWPHKKVEQGVPIGGDKTKRASLKSIQLSQIIGIKRLFAAAQADEGCNIRETNSIYKNRTIDISHKHDRIKIYYAKEIHSRYSGQFVKLKKLDIQHYFSSKEPPQAQSSTSSSGDRNLAKKYQNYEVSSDCQHKKQATVSSAPPSCYASEGSASYLSSLSSQSSSVDCSPSPSPIQTPDSDVSPQLLPSSVYSTCPAYCANSGNLHRDQITSTQAVSSELAKLNALLQAKLAKLRERRPKRLIVFVNPYGGKGNALYLYNSRVKHLLELAEVEATLVVTKYANHARDTVEDPQFNVEYFDGIICVGGDGMFSELMNGLLFRYNRDKILKARLAGEGGKPLKSADEVVVSTDNKQPLEHLGGAINEKLSDQHIDTHCESDTQKLQVPGQHDSSWAGLGGVGQKFSSPPIPIGVIGAGSTDANSYGLIGTNDVITATLNIILGHQIKIDACSIHSFESDDLLKFVSTFVAYGYFGDVIRESEKLRWLGPSRYDVTGANNLIKNRSYKGTVKILISDKDGSPSDPGRCSRNCQVCWSDKKRETSATSTSNHGQKEQLILVERRGSFIGVNAAVTACRCPQTKKGFSPNNHLANGCADLILVRPCTRIQYMQYLLRTGWTKKSAFDLGYVEAFRCRQFEFQASLDAVDEPANRDQLRVSFSQPNKRSKSGSLKSSSEQDERVTKIKSDNSTGALLSSWNVDGEILNEQSIRVKVNNQLLSVFGTGGPSF